ncbi:hypothetical protein [Rhodopirellula bahusiensis]|uniref:hypothetical protein n=1 Tax=Rhodopirellula bahusiensis TaxID=2014065 RepID=UPI001304208E|nr:hypothetical protein [Rhodopirellula bahusiensis]
MDQPRRSKPEWRSRLASTEASAWVPGETWPTLLHGNQDLEVDFRKVEMLVPTSEE